MGYRWLKVRRWLSTAVWVPLIFVTVGPLLAGQQATIDATAGRAWKFSVFLDDQEIGYHHFFLTESGDTRVLKSVADFEYRLLFIPVYRYEHENTEIWNGNCLQSINSHTDANGDLFRVDGRLSDGEFRVMTFDGEQTLPDCVMSFAYWNPAFIGRSRLLNSQDGKFLDVDFLTPVLEEFEIDGNARPAWRHGLVAEKLKIKLWYSAAGEWIGLESEVRGGRVLRYELELGNPPEPEKQDPRRTALLENSLMKTGKGQ